MFVMELTASEIDRVMAYVGCRSIAEIGPEILHGMGETRQ